MIPLKFLVEYFAVRMIALTANILPYHAAIIFGWVHSWISHYLFHFRRNEAKRRIRTVFCNKLSEADLDKIAWHSWRNIVLSGIEMMRTTKSDVRRMYNVPGNRTVLDAIKKFTDTGKGAIIAVPHMGSWEMAACAAKMHGVPVFSIAARQKNFLTSDYLVNVRSRRGIDTISRGSSAIKDVLTRLTHGEALAILSDVRVRTLALSIPFLGGTANIGEGMAIFAKQTDSPILAIVVKRIGLFNHSLTLCETIMPDKSLDKKTDVSRMTACVLKHFEKAIMEDPGQWFWYNKRWILDPLEAVDKA
jgi:Kdo2-lipid IVA lauroyltransferase/acyltransferase